MSEPETQLELVDTPEAAPEAPEPEPQAAPETDDPKPEDQPEVKEKLRKLNSENKALRQRLKDQEPLVTAAQEAEKAKMSELEREQANTQVLRDTLTQRDTELLVERYHIPEDLIEFIGEGSFEEKEARAAKIGQMQPKTDPQERPPSDRPVESLKPGASPSTPPVEDHSYPPDWGRPRPRAS